MTSDAKIGLLLGLVFIFIIAFVINGLPRFRNTTNGSELTTNMVSSQNDPLGIGDRERKVQNLIDWPQPQVEDRQLQTETVQPPSQDDGGIRYQRNLPDIIPYTPIVETAEESESAPAEPAVVDSGGIDGSSIIGRIANHSSGGTRDGGRGTMDEPRATNDESRETGETRQPEPSEDKKNEIKKPRPVRPASPKVYTTCDGDTLSLIAKKFYGTEEGNKLANIMRIFEANRGVLPSADQVKIGQNLLIPPPVASQKVQNKTEQTTLPGALFEKVESVGRKILQPDKPEDKPKPTPPRQYVVQDGDYLWRIAAQQLGDGNRYKEIAKLNADILTDENSLSIGTTLKLPAR
ncbi:MAG: hypothetical protein A2Z25_07355 [Planctomycetes bacterium RBG_16_55_9]|nr:MAG: hypothetical protein A2Z25_07355 [Planctomycetes bacterium RBG_16_55_9]